MYPYINNFEQNLITPCECCRPRLISCTSTTHKWTKQEIIEEILYYSKELRKCKWYEKARIVDNLRHWAAKLQRIEDVESEFDLSTTPLSSSENDLEKGLGLTEK